MKPSWGKTIGVFVLCWVFSFLACVLVSFAMGHSLGFMGYSTGGLSVLVIGIICSAIYRSRGKAGGVLFASIVAGAIIGLLAVLIATQMFANQSVSTNQNASDVVRNDEQSVESAVDETDYLGACETDEARAVLKAGRCVLSNYDSHNDGDELDSDLNNVSFGCVNKVANGKDHYQYWTFEPDGVPTQHLVQTEEAIIELERIASAQMCGGFDKREQCYVGSHLYEDEEGVGITQRAFGEIRGSSTIYLESRYYLIDDRWWETTTIYHTAASVSKPENYRGRWQEEPWCTLTIARCSEDTAREMINS